MKFRQGFISNSSSTSFCIYGYYLDKYIDCDYDIRDKTGIEVYSNPNSYGDSTYIGIPLSTIGDEETFKQFKQRVEATINNYINIPEGAEIGILESSWYDG